jgi:hypothetical protein
MVHIAADDSLGPSEEMLQIHDHGATRRSRFGSVKRQTHHISVLDVATRAQREPNFWGLTAHGLFILQCSNYLFLMGLLWR